MSKRTSNKTLALVFGVLLLLVLIIIFSDSGKNERTFREVLVNIDTSAVTSISLYPKSQNHSEVKLFKENNNWKVVLADGKIAGAPNDKVKNLFNQLLGIKPKRLAARDITKWTEFQVDSTGTRIVVNEGNKETLNLILGRFSFQQPRSMSTYVRLTQDTDVYEVDGFLDMTFNQNANSFRDGTGISADYKNWQRLSFDYPSDSSFQMTKIDNRWMSNDLVLDSAKTENYLRKIGRLTSSDFLDNVESKITGAYTYKLSIDSGENGEHEINAVIDSSGYIIYSSMNSGTFFDGSQNQLGKKMFIELKSLLP